MPARDWRRRREGPRPETSFHAKDVAHLLVQSTDMRDRSLFWTLLGRTASTTVLARSVHATDRRAPPEERGLSLTLAIVVWFCVSISC